MLRWESVETCHSSKRILKLEMVSMHVASEGALVNGEEEYWTSSFASS